MSAACRSCGQPIVWATNFKTGKRMPLDPDWTFEGVRFTIDAAGGAHVVADPNTSGLRSHFSSCPNADEHRKPR